MDGFVEVYSKTTGKKHIVPEQWLGHPVLGKNFAETPSARAGKPTAAAPEGDPSDAWTRDQLDKHAASLGVDTTALRNKSEVLAAIADPSPAPVPVLDPEGDDTDEVDTDPQNPDGTVPSDQTPAAGENKE